MQALRYVLAVTALLGTSAGLAGADVRVRLRGDRIDIEASNAALADILVELARQTGMKVVYDGPPPRAPLTTILNDRSQPEALLALFEGLGLSFALSLDPTGTRVDTLLVVASSGGGRSAPAPARAPQGIPRPTLPPEDPAAEGEPEEPPPLEPETPTEAAEETVTPGQPTPVAPIVLPPTRPGPPFVLRPAPLMFPTPAPSPTPGAPDAPAPEPTATPPVR